MLFSLPRIPLDQPLFSLPRMQVKQGERESDHGEVDGVTGTGIGEGRAEDERPSWASWSGL